MCTGTYKSHNNQLHTYVPGLIFAQTTRHFLGQVNYPIYQQHPMDNDNNIQATYINIQYFKPGVLAACMVS